MNEVVCEGRAGARPHTPRKALLSINPSSRNGRQRIDSALDRLRAGGIELVMAPCRTRVDLTPLILQHRAAVDCVIVAGGDGTVNAAARGVVETGLPLGVLPMGTANDFARSVGIPTDVDAAARVIVDGTIHRVDTGDVNGHAFFNVASIGLAADLAKTLTGDDKRRFGRLSYALSALRILGRARPFHATLISGADRVMVRTLQIAVGNGRFYGGGNVVATDAQIDDGYLDLYSLEFSQVWRMALMIPSFKSGGHGAMRDVRTARDVAFEIVTRKPRPVNADGELVTQTPAVFTQKRRSASVYVPETCPLMIGRPSA